MFIYSGQCDVSINGICYKVNSDSKNRESAELSCQSEGGMLAEVLTQEVQDSLRQSLRNRNLQVAWLGGKETMTDWRWIKGNLFCGNLYH